MKNYLAVFTGTPEALERSGWNALDDATREQRTRAGMAGWHAWMRDHASRLVVAGGPLGKTLRVSPAGVEAARNNLAGYVVVSAGTQEEAAGLFEGHPHFSIFPGEAVEVMECLPVPGATHDVS